MIARALTLLEVLIVITLLGVAVLAVAGSIALIVYLFS